jgi:O-antigen/teichoic acid export membrane protein
VKARVRIALRLGLGQALGRGAVAIYTIAMIRELSRAGYGDFAYALALVGIGVSLGDGGFARLMIREIARSDRVSALAREMLLVRSLFAVGVAVVFSLTALAGVLPFRMEFAAAVGAYLLLETLAAGYEAAAVGSERPYRFVAAQAASAVALAIAGWAVAQQPSPLPEHAMLGLVFASVVRFGVGWVQWHAGQADRGRPLDRLPVRDWFRDALPFLGLAALVAIYYRSNVIILHAMHGAAETAPYAAALRIFDAVTILGGLAFAAVSPVISRAHAQDPGRIWSLWTTMIVRMAVPAVAVAVVTAALAPQITDLLFGPGYARETSRALTILAPAMGLVILQNLTGAVVLMADRHGAVLRLTAVNLTLALLAAIVLCRLYKSDGAAMATVLAELLSFTTFAVLVARRYRSPATPNAGAP